MRLSTEILMKKYNYPYYQILEKLYFENNDLGKLAIIKN